MNKLFKKVLAGVLACSMLGSMSAVALAADNTVTITKVEVLNSADDTQPTEYTGENINNAKLSAGQLIRVTAKTTNSNTSPYLTFLSYKKGSEATLDNTTVQYVAQDSATSDTEKTFTFRPRTTVGAGTYTAKVGATGVAASAEISYTVKATMTITAPNPAISFAKNNPPEDGITFDFATDGTLLDENFATEAKVCMDSNRLDSSNYTITPETSGSTVTTGKVTIKKAALTGLEVGKHKVVIEHSSFVDAVLADAFAVTGEEYNITFNVNGGDNLEDGVGNFTADKVGKSLPTPEKSHKTFGGWYLDTDTDYANKIENYATDLNGKTLVARWNDTVWKIDYKNNEGATVKNDATLPTSYVEGEGATIPELEKQGNTFDGWYTDDGVWENEVSIDENTTENITAYAKFTPHTFTFKYMSNNKEYTEEGKDSYTYGTDFTFPTPSGSDYVPGETPNFAGWYTDAQCTDGNQVVSPTQAVAGKENGAAITLYAKWSKEARYTLIFNYKFKKYSDGRIYETVLTGAAGQKIDNIITYKDEDGSAEGYDCKFIGWATDSKATEAISDADLAVMTFPEGESNLYPIFGKTPIIYTVTFNTKGGELYGYGDNEISYTVEANNALPTAVRDGYAFGGWYTDEACTEANRVKEWSLALGTTTLYAKWTQDWVDVEQLTGENDVKVTKFGNIYKVTKVETETAKIDNYVGYAVVYKEDGTLKSVTAAKAENTNEFTVTIPATGGGETAKLFIWNKTNAQPVITVVSGN